MADHTRNAMRAAARAMQEVVLPAVDAAHPLAREQAGLVLKYLQLWESRIDLAYERNRFELLHYLGLASTLRAGPLPPSPAIIAALEDAIARGTALRDEPGARASALQTASERLAAVISALVRTASSVDDPSRERIEAVVVSKSKELLDVQRAWFLPQGWEPDTQGLPSIEVALAQAGNAAAHR